MFRACFLSESADARPFLAGATAIRDVGARRRLEKSELAENGGVGSAVHADSGAEVLGKTVQAGEECGAIDVHGIEGVQHGFTGRYGDIDTNYGVAWEGGRHGGQVIRKRLIHITHG